MAEKTSEQLSALMDGECLVPELELALRRLAKDAELRACWQRYHLISDALKNNVPDAIDCHLAERIGQAIVAEPLVPIEERAVEPKTWYKPVTGFALAASVALVAFVGFNLTQPQISTELQTASTQNLPPSTSSTSQSAPTNTALEARLNNYLVSHNELASMHSVHGVLPYVRMVGYQPNQ